MNIEGKCQERFLHDALHTKVRSTSPSVRNMDKEFMLLAMHKKKLSPSPRVLKEYKELIKTTEEQVSFTSVYLWQRQIAHSVQPHVASVHRDI